MAKRATSTSDASGDVPNSATPGQDEPKAEGGQTGQTNPTAVTVRDVTFRIPAGDAGSAALVGDFNGWSTDATPMELHDASFEVTLELAPGEYQYRYLLDGERWENDWNADDYAPNQFGGDDSVRRV